MSAWRQIHEPGHEIRYRLGRQFAVIVVDGARHNVNFSELTGMSWSDIERARYKGWLSIKPSDVHRHVRDKVINAKNVAPAPEGSGVSVSW